MATELKTDQLARSDTVHPNLFSDRNPFRKKEEPLLSQIRNEFENNDIEILKPLQPVIMKVPDRSAQRDARGRFPLIDQDLTQELVDEFEYLSRTRDLETDTLQEPSERVRILQEKVFDKMTQGTGIQTRVVIMRRDDGPNAFVTPDGTVFVAQSLLNQLGTLDEIAAVAAHELSHLINKTTFHLKKDDHGNSFGIAWIHEAACDLKAPEILEKAGFNSMAFASAIEKISGHGRGLTHQSGLARASQSIGQHWAIDRSTSSIPQKPIPEILKAKRAKPNPEIVRELIFKYHKTLNKRSLDIVNSALQALHPRDLETIFLRFQPKGVRDNIVSLIKERFQKNNYTQPEIDLFFLTQQGFHVSQYSDYVSFKSPRDLVEVAKVIADPNHNERMQEMNHHAFDARRPVNLGESEEAAFLRFITHDLLDIDAKNPKVSVRMDEESILDILEILQKKAPGANQQKSDLTQLCTGLLKTYLETTYIAHAADAGQEIDKDQIRDLFVRCKERGIELDQRTIEVFEDLELEWQGGKINSPKQNQLLVNDAFYEVYGREQFNLKNIDEFFDKFKNRIPEISDLVLFIEGLREYFADNSLDDSQRFVYLSQIAKRIDEAKFQCDDRVERFLKTGKRALPYSEELYDTSAYSAFNMKLYLALSLFKGDEPEFYKYIEDAMINSKINADNMSQAQLINLCQGLFAFDSADYQWEMILYGTNSFKSQIQHKNFGIKDYESLFNLPFIKKIIEKSDYKTSNNWEELNENSKAYLETIIRTQESKQDFLSTKTYKDPISLFDEDLLVSIVGRDIRADVGKLLQAEPQDNDLPQLSRFITDYYPSGTQKTNILREIHKRILKSPKIDFDTKIQYLVATFDTVGLEGMAMLADSIKDIKTYTQFREKMGERLEQYLEGSGLINAIAYGDFLSGLISAQTRGSYQAFDNLLKTTNDNPESKRETSTAVAKEWFESLFRAFGNDVVQYDEQRGKFLLNERTREWFKTISDIFSTAHGLSSAQRLAIAHKLLTESGGALEGFFNQAKLGRRTAEALQLKKGFLRDVVESAAVSADPKLISFPAATMLGPLLFRSFDVSAIDIKKVAQTEILNPHRFVSNSKKILYTNLSSLFSEDEIANILSSDTRGVVLFGAKYQQDPDSLAARLTRENDDQYKAINHQLQTHLIPTNGTKKEDQSEVDTSLDTIIRGVENGGPLGIRALQLTTQFYSFTPAVERRLAATFDRNPGLNKLLFWENLYKLAQENSQVAEFLANVRLGDYLGGGSLQTTYAATVTTSDGQQRPVVIKLRNPNVEAFINESYQSAKKTLSTVIRQTSNRKNREYAQAGQALIDLAREWCLDDIKDETFEQDDDRFRQTVDRFNQGRKDFIFEMPQRSLTHLSIKAEELIPGQTLNQYLKDESVSEEEKRKAVEATSEFFIFQLKTPIGQNTNGDDEYLIHSDPHIGNYIMNLSSDGTKIGVIDRSYYLELSQRDVRVLEKLIVSGNNTEFADAFIERVLDTNQTEGPKRAAVKNGVFRKLGREVAFQMVRGGVDRLALMRIMLTELSSRGMEIPLNLRLMIRNIGAFQELTKRHGLDLEKIYKES